MALVKGKPDQYGDMYDLKNVFRRYVPEEKIRYTEPVPAFYSVGVDLGSVNDSTSIAIVEVLHGFEILEGHSHATGEVFEIKRTPDLHFLVRLLHRPRLGTSYPLIIDQVSGIMEELPPLPKAPILTWDNTGLGMPIVQNARLKPNLRHSIGLTITSGQTATMHGLNWQVPKGYLVGELRLAMHHKRLHIAQGFRDRETLQVELEAFTAKLSASGRATFEAAGSAHDDTVLSLSMAIVAAKHRYTNTARQVPIGKP